MIFNRKQTKPDRLVELYQMALDAANDSRTYWMDSSSYWMERATEERERATRAERELRTIRAQLVAEPADPVYVADNYNPVPYVHGSVVTRKEIPGQLDLFRVDV